MTDYEATLLEQIASDNKIILEAVGNVQEQLKLTAKQADLEEVKAEVKLIKSVLTDTNKQVQDHEVRLTRLETAA